MSGSRWGGGYTLRRHTQTLTHWDDFQRVSRDLEAVKKDNQEVWVRLRSARERYERITASECGEENITHTRRQIHIHKLNIPGACTSRSLSDGDMQPRALAVNQPQWAVRPVAESGGAEDQRSRLVMASSDSSAGAGSSKPAWGGVATAAPTPSSKPPKRKSDHRKNRGGGFLHLRVCVGLLTTTAWMLWQTSTRTV